MAGSSLVWMATGQPSTLAPFIMMRLVGMVLAVAWSAPTPRPPPAKGVLVQPTMQYLTYSTKPQVIQTMPHLPPNLSSLRLFLARSRPPTVSYTTSTAFTACFTSWTRLEPGAR